MVDEDLQAERIAQNREQVEREALEAAVCFEVALRLVKRRLRAFDRASGRLDAAIDEYFATKDEADRAEALFFDAVGNLLEKRKRRDEAPW